MQRKKDDSVSILGKCSQVRLEDRWGNSSVCETENGKTKEKRRIKNELHHLERLYLN